MEKNNFPKTLSLIFRIYLCRTYDLAMVLVRQFLTQKNGFEYLNLKRANSLP
jgi:hypothetical protein